MNTLLSKIIVVVLIFLGESLSIYAEMLGAKTHAIASRPILSIFLKMFLLIILAGGLLLIGYILGFKAFKNIWIVSVVSITSILVTEPILAWLFFHQLPTKGALIGLVLGILGFISAIFF